MPTLAGTLTRTDSTITGPLCVAARTTTTPLPLTTGIEFGPGQTVQLMKRAGRDDSDGHRRDGHRRHRHRGRGSGSTCAACSSRG